MPEDKHRKKEIRNSRQFHPDSSISRPSSPTIPLKDPPDQPTSIRVAEEFTGGDDELVSREGSPMHDIQPSEYSEGSSQISSSSDQTIHYGPSPLPSGSHLSPQEPTVHAQATATLVNNKMQVGRDSVVNVGTGNVNIVNIETERVLGRLKDLLNPVSAAAYDSYEAERERNACLENTRVQVLSEIEEWISGSGNQAPIFILDGIAGIGKSTVAQSIAERAAAKNLLGASFYFSRNEDLRKIAQYFFPTVAFQLAVHSETFASRLVKAFDRNPDASKKGLPLQFSMLISDPLQDLLAERETPILLVIDALDECEEEGGQTLLKLLTVHVPQLDGLRVLITSRPESHLRQVLEADTRHNIFRLHNIESSIVQSDIKLYLTHHLSTITLPANILNWPNADDIQCLCNICGVLFIAASTAVKFVMDPRCHPLRQLSLLLANSQSGTSSSLNYAGAIDRMYLQILLSSIPSYAENRDDDWFCQYRQALGAVLTLETPLPCQTLATLLGVEEYDIITALSYLHSLVAPSDPGVTFQIHHKSFPDFITNPDRLSKTKAAVKHNNCHLAMHLLIIPADHHLQLAKACLQVMITELHYNMAGLSPNDWHQDMSELPSIAPSLISGQLQYAALHWASHMLNAHNLDSGVQGLLHNWSTCYIPMWIEVMCILKKVDSCQDKIQMAIAAIKKSQTSNVDTALPTWLIIQELLVDSWRFILKSAAVMKVSPMHVYWSCFQFLPRQTLLYQQYAHIAATRLAGAETWDNTWITLSGHSNEVHSVAFSPDGLRLASSSADATIMLWNTKSGTNLVTFTGHSSMILSIAFSPNGQQIASASLDHTVRLWDAKSGVLIATLTGHSNCVKSVDFSPDGLQLASASGDKTVKLWDAKSGVVLATLTGHSDWVLSVAFSPNGLKLASASDDKTVRLWDTMSGTALAVFTGHSGNVNSVAFSSNGLQLASADNHTIRLWDVESGATQTILTEYSSHITSIAFSPDWLKLAAGTLDRRVILWDVKSHTVIAHLKGHSGSVRSVKFSPDSLQLATGSDDSRVRLWSATPSTVISTCTDHSSGVESIAYSTSGLQLVSGSHDSTVKLWDTKSSACLATLVGHSSQVYAVAFSPDGLQLASGSADNTVRLWNTRSGVSLAVLNGHSSYINSVAFSPDGLKLASASNDKTVRLWDAEDGAPLAVLTDHSDSVILIAFSPSGLQLASVSWDQTIELWDARSGAALATLTDHSINAINISVAFSPDSLHLASLSGNSSLKIWCLSTGSLLKTLPTNPFSIQSLLLLPQGALFYAIFHSHQQSPPWSALQTASDPVGFSSSFWLFLAQHESAKVYGLVAARLQPDHTLDMVPFCWFPPDMCPQCFSIDTVSSTVAVGFGDGQILQFDLLSIFTRDVSFLMPK